MYAYKNMTPSEICRYLDNLKIKPLKSDTWSTNSIRDILSNPTYIGKIRWKDRKIVKVIRDGKVINTQPKNKGNDVILVDGVHPAIIDTKTFDIVQQKKKDNNTAPIPGIYNIQNPLAGLVRCAKCKRIMFRNNNNILCCTNTKCDNVSSKIEIIEKKILESLEIWLENYEKEINSIDILQSNTSDIINIKTSSMKKIKENLNECNIKSEKIYDFLEKGIYTIDIFIERKNKILKEQKELTLKYTELEKELSEITQTEKAKRDLIPQTKNVLVEYNNCSDMKKEMIY